MSEAAVNAALNRMGYKDVMTAHGFRAMARTVLVEQLDYPIEHVEMQLGHSVWVWHSMAATGPIFSKRNLCAKRLTQSCSFPRHSFSFYFSHPEKLSKASFKKRPIRLRDISNLRCGSATQGDSLLVLFN